MRSKPIGYSNFVTVSERVMIANIRATLDRRRIYRLLVTTIVESWSDGSYGWKRRRG